MRKVLPIFLILVRSAFSDSSEIRMSISDFQAQPQNIFYSGDAGIILNAESNYCLDPDKRHPGEYDFEYTISAPDGGVVHHEFSARHSLPQIPMWIRDQKSVLPLSIFRGNGQYTLTIIYHEYYPDSQTRINRSLNFRMFAGSRPGGDFNSIDLMSPADKSVTTSRPLFVWKPVRAGARYNIFLAQQNSPLSGYLWKKEGLTESSVFYDGAFELQKGTQYFWQIEAVDQTGASILSNQGKSPVWSFHLSEPELSDEIRPDFPVDRVINFSNPVFRWHSSGENNEFQFRLAEGFESNYIWIYNTKAQSLSYPPDLPQLKEGRKYYWQVIRQSKGSATASGVSWFEVRLPSEWRQATTVETHSPAGGVIAGNVIDSYNQVLPGSVVSIRKYPDGSADSITADQFGRFCFSGLSPGHYKISALKQSDDEIKLFEGTADLAEKEILDLKLVAESLKNRLTIRVFDDSGRPLSNVQVRISDAQMSSSARTGEDGSASVLLGRGVFRILVQSLPDFGLYEESGVNIVSDRNLNVFLSRTKSGAARMRWKQAGTNHPLNEIKLEGRLKTK